MFVFESLLHLLQSLLLLLHLLLLLLQFLLLFLGFLHDLLLSLLHFVQSLVELALHDTRVRNDFLELAGGLLYSLLMFFSDSLLFFIFGLAPVDFPHQLGSFALYVVLLILQFLLQLLSLELELLDLSVEIVGFLMEFFLFSFDFVQDFLAFLGIARSGSFQFINESSEEYSLLKRIHVVAQFVHSIHQTGLVFIFQSPLCLRFLV